MIMKLLEIRTILLKIYQKARFIINPIIKFILSIMVFNWINDAVGYDTRLTSNVVVLLLSAVSAVTPGGVLVFLAMLVSLLHIYSASKFIAVLVLLAYAIMYGLLMRFSPKQALAAVAIPVLAKYNLHYCVPIVLGCTSTPLSGFACVCGVFICYTTDIFKAAMTRQIEMNLDDILQLYTDIADALMSDRQMYIAMVIFVLVIIVVFLIRKLSFDYAFIISIGAGIVTNILGFLVADLRFDVTVNVGTLLIMSIVSGAVACLVEFAKRVLDYSAVEHVQFEDDDYYYYVKAVPKVDVSIPRHAVRRMSDYSDEEDEDAAQTEDMYDSDYGAEYTPAGRRGQYYEDGYTYDRTGEAAGSSDEISYEEFDEDDFDETERIDYGEDMSDYGIRRIDTGSSDEADSDTAEDEGYEVEMTLDDADE